MAEGARQAGCPLVIDRPAVSGAFQVRVGRRERMDGMNVFLADMGDSVLHSALIGGIIGAVVGLLAGVVAMFRKKPCPECKKPLPSAGAKECPKCGCRLDGKGNKVPDETPG
jgi:hypothetical protein